MLTAQMPALTRALSGVLPPAALKQLTQSLGNCNQEMIHRGPIAFAPDSWQNANNNNGTYSDFPPSINDYNEFYNNIVNQSDYTNNISVSNPFYNNVTNLGDIIITTGGPAGRDGRDGLGGLAGIDGVNGVDGRSGQDGQDGQAGPGGAPGDPGAAGNNGRDGRDGGGGQAGAAGADGAAGAAGAPGAAGGNGRDGRDGRGVDSLKTKPFVSTIKTTPIPVVTQVTPQEFEVVVGVTFDDSTCQLQLATATVRGIGSVTNARALESIREIPGSAYAP